MDDFSTTAKEAWENSGAWAKEYEKSPTTSEATTARACAVVDWVRIALQNETKEIALQNEKKENIINDFDIENWSDSHETSVEIAAVIHHLYDGKENNIWENATDFERELILALAWRGASEDTDELFWGEDTYKREETP